MRSTDRPAQLIVAFAAGGSGAAEIEVVAAAVNGLRQRGVSAVARLVAQTYDEQAVTSTPADRLSQLLAEPASTICPPRHWYEVDLPAPFAAEELGRPAYSLAEMIAETHFHPSTTVGFVVAPHGPGAPLAQDGDGLALARTLRPDLALLVCDAEPASVNEAVLGAVALAPVPVVILLTGFVVNEARHELTRAWLAERFEVITTPDQLVVRLTSPTAATA